MAIYPASILLLFGIFPSLDINKSQDAVLHAIFSEATKQKITNTMRPDVCINMLSGLRSLYYMHDWHFARSFFYVATGTLFDIRRPRLTNYCHRINTVPETHIDLRQQVGSGVGFLSLYYDNTARRCVSESSKSRSESESESDFPATNDNAG